MLEIKVNKYKFGHLLRKVVFPLVDFLEGTACVLIYLVSMEKERWFFEACSYDGDWDWRIEFRNLEDPLSFAFAHKGHMPYLQILQNGVDITEDNTVVLNPDYSFLRIADIISQVDYFNKFVRGKKILDRITFKK
jgi:hypothetical protein